MARLWLGAAAALFAASALAWGPGAIVGRAACAPPAGHALVALAGGRVLVSVATEAELTNKAEIYDPAADRWTPADIQRDGGVRMTLLADGRVLMTGTACDRYGPQIYDPRTDAVTAAGAMLVPNAGNYTAVLLRSGKVLFAGGYGGPRDVGTQPRNIAELYDPTTNTWSAAAPTLSPRFDPQALLLADGRVFVAGGAAPDGGPPPFVTTAEIYDPATDSWTAAGQIPTNGSGTSALAKLGNGLVLAAGGAEDSSPTSTTLLFDPSARTWSRTGSMTFARSGANAVTLPDGSVLVVGGQGIAGRPLTSAERFDPVTNQWSVVPGSPASIALDQSAVALKDGRVLIAAWPDFVFGHWSTADVQVFDPKLARPAPSPTQPPAVTGAWSNAPDLPGSFGNYSPAGGGFSSSATATLLPDDRILLLGTDTYSSRHSFAPSPSPVIAAIYEPATGKSRLLASPGTIYPVGFTATLLRTGKVLVLGVGAQLYDPSTDHWSPVPPPPSKPFAHTATILPNGTVLVAGGLGLPTQPNGGYIRLTSAQIFDPGSNTWSVATDLPDVLGGDNNTATLLRNGRVLVLGGYNPSAALYDPKSNLWVAAPSLIESAQTPHTATLLTDGRVLVLPGCAERGVIGCNRFATPQIFDPAKNTWSRAAPMLNSREWFSATQLQSGQVLVAGGRGPTWVVSEADLYDPSGDRWIQAGDMKVARAGPTATLLRNGSVLILGGVFLDNLRTAELYTPPPSTAAPAKPGATSQQPGLKLLLSGAALLAMLVSAVLLFKLWSRKA